MPNNDDTLSLRVQKALEANPDMKQVDIAKMCGCSTTLVSLIKNGKREPQEVEDNAVEVLSEDAAFLMMEKARHVAHSDNEGLDPKERNALSDAALKYARAWATFAGKATNRDRDRDEEPMSRQEAQAVLAAMKKSDNVVPMRKEADGS